MNPLELVADPAEVSECVSSPGWAEPIRLAGCTPEALATFRGLGALWGQI